MGERHADADGEVASGQHAGGAPERALRSVGVLVVRAEPVGDAEDRARGEALARELPLDRAERIGGEGRPSFEYALWIVPELWTFMKWTGRPRCSVARFVNRCAAIS